MVRYCVFWIPCIAHKELNVLEGNSSLESREFTSREGIRYSIKPEASIVSPSNPESDPIVKIKVAIIQKGDANPDFHKKVKVVLESVECCGNGLIQFKYSLGENDLAIFNDVRNIVYAFVKEHFHSHVYHKQNGGLKEGLFLKEQITLRSQDNDALKFYFDQIYTLLKSEISQLSYDYQELIEREESDTPQIRQARNLFFRRCEDIFGEIVFFNSLLNSKWNVSCRLQPMVSNYDNQLYSLAHNIHNLIERLHVIYRKSLSSFYFNRIDENHYLQEELKKMTVSNGKIAEEIDSQLKASKTSNWISLGLGIISVLLGILSVIPLIKGCVHSDDFSTDISNTSSVSSDTITSVSDEVKALPLTGIRNLKDKN